MKPAACLLLGMLFCGIAAAQQKIVTIRVHGNHTIRDEEVLKIAGVSPGDPMSGNMVGQIEKRLLDSRRFESTEVKVRYRSLDESGGVALVILVKESQSVTSHFMVGPIFHFSDEYGVTFGAHIAMVDLFAEGGRVSFPLSWGGKRQIAAKFELPIGASGPDKNNNRLLFSVDRNRMKNPHFDVPDNRFEAGGAFHSPIRFLYFGIRGDWTDVRFDELDESFVTASAQVAIDTRVDELMPGDAVYLGFGWDRLFFGSVTDRSDVNRYCIDFRGYKRLFGRPLLAGQLLYNPSGGPLPPYEKPFLGGGKNVRIRH